MWEATRRVDEPCRTNTRCGRCPPPHEVTVAAVAERARTLLTEPYYAEQAGRVQRGIDRMPGPAETVPVLRALASCP